MALKAILTTQADIWVYIKQNKKILSIFEFLLY